MMVYLKLMWSYLKIGLFGFGGGYAMLALVQDEVVGNGWISQQGFTDIVAISQMTPGPIGINSATYIGYTAPAGIDPALSGPIWGILGAILCTIAVVIPPLLLVLYTSHFINRHKDSIAIKGIFTGLRIIIVGLIASAALTLINKANFGSTDYQITCSVIICISAFCLVYFAKLHPILVITLAGITGFLIY